MKTSRRIIPIVFFIYFGQVHSQSFNGSWEEVGPDQIPEPKTNATGIGRINDIELHPNWNGTGNQKLLAGSFNGGMWFSEDNGSSWENMGTDNWPVLGVSDIEYDPDDTNTIFVATGDHDIQFGRYESS